MSSVSALIVILSSFRNSDSQTCPDDTLFTTCKNGGWEDASSCNSSIPSVVAYGLHPYWVYYEKPADIDLTCDDLTFGDPYIGQRKRCCKLQYDLSGNSNLSSVVNTISCGETKYDYYRPDYPSIAHFWKFTLDDAYVITIENCHTLYDTKMYLRDAQGQRLSNTTLGCDGDNCNCGMPGINEAFIDVLLSAGDYYIEILPFDSLTAAGIYYLSTSCAVVTTSSPTAATNIPTDALSSAPSTPLPTGTPKRFCGTTAHFWCYDVDLYPSLTTETTHTVFITNPQDNVATYFNIGFTIHDNHCVKPSILFSFEEIDFSEPVYEYVTLYDNDMLHFATCNGSRDQCGNWIDCFAQPEALRTNTLNAGEIYFIYIDESYAINARCTHYHPYSLNAKLTIICSADSASPTKSPTVDPSPSPTAKPTDHEAEVNAGNDEDDEDDEENDEDDDDDEDEDADGDEDDKLENDFNGSYVVQIVSFIVSISVCCALAIFIWSQFKPKLRLPVIKESELEERVRSESQMDGLNVITENEAEMTSMGPLREPGGNYTDVETTVTIPQLPEETIGEHSPTEDDYTSESDEELDVEDLYITPSARHTIGNRTAGDHYAKLVYGNEEEDDLEPLEDKKDADDDEDSDDDIYEEPKQQTKVGINADEDNSEDSDDDMYNDETDILYRMPTNDEDVITKEKETDGSHGT